MLNFFSYLPALPLISSVSPSPKAKKLLSSFATSDYELLSTKNYNIPSKVVAKTSRNCCIKCYTITVIHMLNLTTTFCYTDRPKQAIF